MTRKVVFCPLGNDDLPGFPWTLEVSRLNSAGAPGEPEVYKCPTLFTALRFAVHKWLDDYVVISIRKEKHGIKP